MDKFTQERERDIAITEQLKLDQVNLSLEHMEGAAEGFNDIQEIIDAIAEGQMPEIDRQTMDMLRHIRNMKISGTNMDDTMLEISTLFEISRNTIQAMLSRLVGQKNLAGTNQSKAGKSAESALGVEPEISITGDYVNARRTLTGAWAYNLKQGELAYQKINPHLFGPAGMTATTGVLDIWRNFSNSQIQGLRDTGSIKFARGGILREPVFGVGASGQTYQFGEKGPETISPVGGGEATILTFNVYGMGDVHEFEAKVKPMVMRWLKESKSNRGIL